MYKVHLTKGSALHVHIQMSYIGIDVRTWLAVLGRVGIDLSGEGAVEGLAKLGLLRLQEAGHGPTRRRAVTRGVGRSGWGELERGERGKRRRQNGSRDEQTGRNYMRPETRLVDSDAWAGTAL